MHAFGDASGKGVAAAVYTSVVQEKGVNQGLVASRARLAKKGLTIPRLELVSGHMAVNLLSNVSEALEGFPVSVKYCWLDSTVALHWIRHPREYKQFVSNRVQKIQAHSDVVWHHVRTSDNPADIGSHSGEVTNHALWWNGPEWLSNKASWPPDIVTSATQESLAEPKAKRDLLSVAVAAADELDDLLEKSSQWRTIRVTAWILRYIQNSRAKKTKRLGGPLTADETKKAELFWEKRVQVRATADGRYKDDLLQLNLQPNCDGVLECRGRVQGHYPIYLPDGQRYTEKLVAQAHLATLHGGVGSTMAKVREYYWVPRLRRLTKKIVKSCHGCRRFRVQAYTSPPPGNLPRDRTEGQTPFQVTGVDFAGPLRYWKKPKTEGKAYILLYACRLTRAVYVHLVLNLETTEFIRSFKCFIARRGRPRRIYSDNAKTFVSGSKWIEQVMKDEKISGFLTQQGIEWKFNLSCAP